MIDDAPDIPAEGMRCIAEPLRGLAVPIGSLTLDPANARQHSPRNLDAIKNSLAKFGQRKPVVVRRADRVVMAGNGTVVAARDLGWPLVAAVLVDDDATTAAAFAIADNRTAELASWDWEALAKTIDGISADGFDVALLGFTEDEIKGISASTFTPEPVNEEEFGSTNDYLNHSIKMTAEQYEVVSKAITAVRNREAQSDISEGRALELICLDFMA